ncbi:DUF4156 domain-containing protein [Orbaceae bacterium ac157xtp]
MLLKKSLCLIATLSLAATVLTGCESASKYQLTQAGQHVQFVDLKPADDCQFLGKVEGRRGTFFSGNKTHSELIREAAIDLLNNAAKMGGNVIHNAQDTSMRYVSSLAPTDAVMEGDVYRCPTK